MLQNARKIAGRPYYLLRPRLWAEQIAIVDQRTMVSHRRRYVCLRIPKAANSTVLRALLEHFPEPGVHAGDVERAKRKVTHLGDVGLRDMAKLRGYFAFTVVRDPYSRTLSAYLDKIREGDKHFDKFGARIAAFDDGRASFRGFCRFLAAGGEAENAHWMRQTRLTNLLDRLDMIGRVETLDADLRRILARIGGGAASVAAIARAGPPPTEASARLVQHYDDECREIVATVYAEDFRAFGYRPDGDAAEG